MKEQYNSVTYSELLERVNKLEEENKELKDTLSRCELGLKDIDKIHRNDVSLLFNMIVEVYDHLHAKQSSVFINDVLPKLNKGMNDPLTLIECARIMVDDLLYGKHENDESYVSTYLEEMIKNLTQNLNNGVNKYERWEIPYPDRYFENKYRGYKFKTI